MAPSKQTSRQAFTLIELLVVVAVIALLIGLLLPALGASREAAVKTQCLSGSRQMGVGVALYATENNNALLPVALPDATASGGIRLWNMVLIEMFNDLPVDRDQGFGVHVSEGGKGVAEVCPNFDRDEEIADLIAQGLDQRAAEQSVLTSLGTGYNRYPMLGTSNERARGNVWDNANFSDPDENPEDADEALRNFRFLKLDQIQRPAMRLMLGDADTFQLYVEGTRNPQALRSAITRNQIENFMFFREPLALDMSGLPGRYDAADINDNIEIPRHGDTDTIIYFDGHGGQATNRQMKEAMLGVKSTTPTAN